MLEEFRKAWPRFWALSWWWKGPTLGVTAFIVLIVGIAVASGCGDSDMEGREPIPTATTVTPTSSPSVMPTEIPTPEPTPTPSPTPDSTPTPEPTQPAVPTPSPPLELTPTPPPPDCDPSYPDFCIRSPPPELDCGGIVFRNFTVLPPDPHGFDEDNDGKGCE